MVTLELDDDPTPAEVERAIDRIQQGGAYPRGITGGRSLTYDEDTKTLRLNFDHLKRVLLEHRMFEEADGFSATELDVLRVVEDGPDRMSLAEIRAGVNEDRDPDDTDAQDPLADSTLQHYLRNLREKGLVKHAHNQYTYIGP